MYAIRSYYDTKQIQEFLNLNFFIMKTRILSFLIMALGLMVSTSAFAQPLTPTGSSKIATAVDGSTVVYSVTDLSTADVKYVWKLSGGSTSIDGAAYTAGTNLEKIIGTDDPAYSVSINWNVV